MTRSDGIRIKELDGREVSISTVEKRDQAVKLRLAGFTYAQIAEKLGYANRAGAYKAVKTQVVNSLTTGAAAEYREIERQRLEQLRLAHLSKGHRDVRYGRLLLDISAQTSRLMGLNVNESKIASAVEASAVADIVAANQIYANLIGAMQEAGVSNEMIDQTIAILNARMGGEVSEDQDDDENNIEGEVEDDDRDDD